MVAPVDILPPGNGNGAASSEGVPDDSWTLDQLASYTKNQIGTSAGIEAQLGTLTRKSVVAFFRAGHALSFARNRLKPSGQFGGWLDSQGIASSTAYEAITLYERAGSEDRVAGMALTQAKRRYGISKAKTDEEEARIREAKAKSPKSPHKVSTVVPLAAILRVGILQTESALAAAPTAEVTGEVRGLVRRLVERVAKLDEIITAAPVPAPAPAAASAPPQQRDQRAAARQPGASDLKTSSRRDSMEAWVAELLQQRGPLTQAEVRKAAAAEGRNEMSARSHLLYKPHLFRMREDKRWELVKGQPSTAA